MATNSQQPGEVWRPQEMQGCHFSFGVYPPKAGLSHWDTHGSALLPDVHLPLLKTLSATSLITSFLLLPSTEWTEIVPEKAIFHPGAGLQCGSSLARRAITRPRCLCAMDGTIHHSLPWQLGSCPAGEPAPCSSPHGHLLLNPGTLSWLSMNPVFLLQNICFSIGHCHTGPSDPTGKFLQECSVLLQTQSQLHPVPLHPLPAVPATGICFFVYLSSPRNWVYTNSHKCNLFLSEVTLNWFNLPKWTHFIELTKLRLWFHTHWSCHRQEFPELPVPSLPSKPQPCHPLSQQQHPGLSQAANWEIPRNEGETFCQKSSFKDDRSSFPT